MAFSPKEAYVIARKFGSDYDKNFVVKAQVVMNNRTKGFFKETHFKGGIHILQTPL